MDHDHHEHRLIALYRITAGTLIFSLPLLIASSFDIFPTLGLLPQGLGSVLATYKLYRMRLPKKPPGDTEKAIPITYTPTKVFMIFENITHVLCALVLLGFLITTWSMYRGSYLSAYGTVGFMVNIATQGMVFAINMGWYMKQPAPPPAYTSTF